MDPPVADPGPQQPRTRAQPRQAAAAVNPVAPPPVPGQPGDASYNIPNDYARRVLVDPNINNVAQDLRNRIRRRTGVVVDEDKLEYGQDDVDTLAHLLMLSLNGQTEMPAQKVQVEYLRGDQQLLVPTAMAMNPIPNATGLARKVPLLCDRYWKATSMTYAEIRELVQANTSQAHIMQVVDARQLTVGTALHATWLAPEWNDTEDTVEALDMTLGRFSSALQFNCDIRDTGCLNRPEMTLSDTAWMTATAVPITRLREHICPRSIQMIAALNLQAVARYDVAAFVRAYGVALGMLPSRESVTQIEWRCVSHQPPPADLAVIRTTQTRFGMPIFALCANLLAMFGLFHLSKDHTYRTNDIDMTRIATSYIQTVRVGLPRAEMEAMQQNLEAIVRTAQHPFGLAQTYWLAQVMHYHGPLAAPLVVRIDVTPPPVQRLMIARAASLEWANLPAGRVVDRLFEAHYQAMDAEIVKIKANAPAYSALYRLYGIAAQQHVDQVIMQRVQTMMPTVYGYVQVTHSDEDGKRDGLGHALSLMNVARDQKGLATLWQNAWARYINSMDDVGVIEFVEGMKHSVQ